MEDGMKKCPKCAEDIKLEAIVCKHCGADLSGKADKNERINEFVGFFLAKTTGFKKDSVEYDSGVAKFTGPKSDFSFILFIALMFLGGIGILYLIYHFVKKPCFVTVNFYDEGWPRSIVSSSGNYVYMKKEYAKKNTEFHEFQKMKLS